MRRVNLFLIILVASLVIVIVLTAIGFAIFTSAQNPTNWMSQMWGGGTNSATNGMGSMMGQTGATQASTNTLLSYYGVLFAVVIGLAVFGIIGVAYYLLYPQIRMGAVSPSKPARQIQSC